ncbi:MAG TPA: A/G-specific adenine glycosylase [Gammaproteobacteria bacterium]
MARPRDAAGAFAGRVLDWHRQHGRRDLPWQHPRTPYRVWVSEIMLQQTQVATVIPYYTRFLAAFPSVALLAAADEDAVLAHWSGLGYYRRARHLQRAARLVVELHGGELPRSVEALVALPGIGRSTAGAILSLGHGLPAPLLDGNVRRLFCRHFGVDGWPGLARVERHLWELAEQHLPTANPGDYNQGLMDLGATLCTRANPDCAGCPLAGGCHALRDGRVAELPAPRPPRIAPQKRTQMLLRYDRGGRLLLERRPPTGIWGGLYAPPECASGRDPEAWCADHGLRPEGLPEAWPLIRHAFSHYRLDITPVRLAVTPDPAGVNDSGEHGWYKPGDALALGLPAPVRRLIERLADEEN